MEVFRKEALRGFEDQMVIHLAEFSPPLFNAVKEPRMREVIRFGIARAANHGFTFRGSVRFYLELMLLFGSHFDTDPQYPWATKILDDQEAAPQMQRAEFLYEATCEYRKQVAGHRDEYTLNALRSLPDLARQATAILAGDFVANILQQMRRVYPQKASYVGDHGLRLVIESGATMARHCGFSTVRAAALCVMLMSAFGHGCFHDPLYPWIGRTAWNERIKDPDARAMRLEKKALTWLDHVLACFDAEARA
jgi:hypothetical protein